MSWTKYIKTEDDKYKSKHVYVYWDNIITVYLAVGLTVEKTVNGKAIRVTGRGYL
jgi:hypothetical protein